MRTGGSFTDHKGYYVASADVLSAASGLIFPLLEMMIGIASLVLFHGSFKLRLAIASKNALAFHGRIHMASILVKLAIKETFMKFYFIFANIINSPVNLHVRKDLRRQPLPR